MNEIAQQPDTLQIGCANGHGWKATDLVRWDEQDDMEVLHVDRRSRVQGVRLPTPPKGGTATLAEFNLWMNSEPHLTLTLGPCLNPRCPSRPLEIRHERLAKLTKDLASNGVSRVALAELERMVKLSK